MDNFLKYARIIAVILIIILILILLPGMRKLTVQDILEYTPGSPFLAFLILIGLFCLKSFLILIPMSVLYICAGVMFNGLWSIVITYLGLTLEMTIGYWIGSRLGKSQVDKFISKNKNKSLEKLLVPSERTFNAVCFIVSIIPGPLPMDIMNMMIGATRISFGRYLLFSLLGVSPGMIATVIAGSAISNPLSKEFLVPFSIAMLISLAAFLILQVMEKKKI